MKHSIERRTFVKLGLTSIAALPLMYSATGCNKGGESASAPSAAPAITKINPDTNPTAKALGYYEDATKVDTAKYPKKAAADGATQVCDNCSFYAASADHKGWGNCTLIAGGSVAAKGWCNSWTKKA